MVDYVALPSVTLIITQRERFSLTKPSLESILADYAAYPFQLIYVDGNSPTSVQHYLQRQARRHAFTLIRQERYLRSNEARNLALPMVTRSDYVVFIDNDVIVEPGWLKALVDCAEAEGAGVVAPVVLQGQPRSPTTEVHVAGIQTKFRRKRLGKRWFEQKQLLYGKRFCDVERTLRRMPVDSVEFHCLLVRRSYLDHVILDEVFDTLASHTDFCFQIAAQGGSIFLEPSSRVTFLNPRHIRVFTPDDLPFYRFKWDDPFVAKNFRHSVRKWNLDRKDPSIWAIWKWVISNRQIPAQLSTPKGHFPHQLLRACRHPWCPSVLRMMLEQWVLELTFPKTGIPSNLDVALNPSAKQPTT
ncbi:glycosyltransferase [Oculatella sp. LEGE 06141]|uniref:glycosyltransferase family 2 protein n=1 Tax=Oculatella sp. LEGE 06141 TaxID=1828648 RepID=UPI00187EA285|nr:glycosyltransferase [Oculatella sp. LEGE 06141]MBE9180826.1 glycosyltransferase [Oculatella sp. LEGE 06141]